MIPGFDNKWLSEVDNGGSPSMATIAKPKLCLTAPQRSRKMPRKMQKFDLVSGPYRSVRLN